MKATTSLRTCLKVSPAVLRAMGEGKHSLLLQPVGSEGFEGHFPIRDLEFFLVPCRDEDKQGIRPEFHELTSGESDRNDRKVTIRYKAQAVDVAMIMEGSSLKAFSDWHIWTDEWLQARLKWNPTNPMFLLTCKVVRLEPPLELPWKEAYEAGPWMRLEEEELPPMAFVPVMEHVDFLKIAVDVKAALAEVQKNPIERPAEEKPAAPAKAAAPPPPPKPAPPAPPKPGADGKQAPAG
jgi:hypothetical protein